MLGGLLNGFLWHPLGFSCSEFVLARLKTQVELQKGWGFYLFFGLSAFAKTLIYKKLELWMKFVCMFVYVCLHVCKCECVSADCWTVLLKWLGYFWAGDIAHPAFWMDNQIWTKVFFFHPAVSPIKIRMLLCCTLYKETSRGCPLCNLSRL